MKIITIKSNLISYLYMQFRELKKLRSPSLLVDHKLVQLVVFKGKGKVEKHKHKPKPKPKPKPGSKFN